MNQEKHCPRCDTTKTLADFGNKRTTTDGKQQWCLPCTRDYYNQWRKKNKPVSKKNEEKSFHTFYSTIHGRAVHMLNNARRRASTKGVDFDLSVEWIEQKLTKGICEITGIPFVLKENNGKGHHTNSFSPSIDRIDQSGPYTEENCQMTCWIYNRAKGAFPVEDLETMLLAILRKRGQSPL